MLDNGSINILPSEEESNKEAEVIGYIGTYSSRQVALYYYKATNISSLSI